MKLNMLFISQTLCHSCLHFHCTLIKLEDICLVFYDLRHPCFFSGKNNNVKSSFFHSKLHPVGHMHTASSPMKTVDVTK